MNFSVNQLSHSYVTPFWHRQGWAISWIPWQGKGLGEERFRSASAFSTCSSAGSCCRSNLQWLRTQSQLQTQSYCGRGIKWFHCVNILTYMFKKKCIVFLNLAEFIYENGNKKVYFAVDLCKFALLFQTIKQDNKEKYRRLLEMVTEKYSKNQPLPFNQTKPKEWEQIHSQFMKYCQIRLNPTCLVFLCSFAFSELLSQSGSRTAASRNPFDSVPKKIGVTGKSPWSDNYWVTISLFFYFWHRFNRFLSEKNTFIVDYWKCRVLNKC